MSFQMRPEFAGANGLFQSDDTNAPQYNPRFYLTLPQ